MATANSVNNVKDDPFAFLNNKKDVKTKNHVDEAQDRFLKMLTTQLQNQDPMNPLDNQAVTSQLAQISTVQGIEKLNKTMQQMASMYSTAQSLSAANMIGRSALVAGSNVRLSSIANSDGTHSISSDQLPRVGVELPQGASSLQFTVYNSNGLPVDTITVGAQEKGVAEFTWDGTDTQGRVLPAGEYSFSVAARNSKGEVIPSTALTYQRVSAVSWENGSPKVHLPDGKRVALDAIHQLGI